MNVLGLRPILIIHREFFPCRGHEASLDHYLSLPFSSLRVSNLGLKDAPFFYSIHTRMYRLTLRLIPCGEGIWWWWHHP